MDTNILVLIVEDEKDTRKSIKYYLSKMEINQVIEADNGAHAMEKLWAHNVGLILSDWHMPDMNGLELLKNVRAIASMEDIPFLMITANKEKGNVIAAMKEGVTNYIVKPFSEKQLIKKIKETLNSSL
jgi:two-component system chemotaxis response regulator CheY